MEKKRYSDLLKRIQSDLGLKVGNTFIDSFVFENKIWRLNSFGFVLDFEKDIKRTSEILVRFVFSNKNNENRRVSLFYKLLYIKSLPKYMPACQKAFHLKFFRGERYFGPEKKLEVFFENNCGLDFSGNYIRQQVKPFNWVRV